jgi:uncharacterized metal-binding protein YceD (DUF177 family)
MPLLCHLHQLEETTLALHEELTPAELELESVDELVRIVGPITCNLQAQLLGHNILVKGDVRLSLQCECVRCLKPFRRPLDLADWTCLLSLEGEDRVQVIGDSVDLTPWVREDIFLALPQHPLCGPECTGLALTSQKEVKRALNGGQKQPPSAWEELNKLKL